MKVKNFDLDYLRENFEYKKDSSKNYWNVLDKNNLKGDCEDFALTALMIETGSWPKFIKELVVGKAKIVHCEAPSGVAHAILKMGDKYIDNWVDKNFLIDAGYKLTKTQYLWPITMIKLILGGSVIVKLVAAGAFVGSVYLIAAISESI